MNQINYFTEYGIVVLLAAPFVFLGIKYIQHWRQLKKAIIEAKIQWPLHSQSELNAAAHINLSKSYGMMWVDVTQAVRIVFSMRTDNPTILKPLRAIRRILLAFILLPIILALMLVTVTAFLVV